MELSREAALLLCGPVLVALLSACALSRFAERHSNCLSFLTSVLGVALSFSIVAVVPYDVWNALALQSLPPSEREARTPSLLRRSWAAIYWTTSLLCYLLCPVLMEFEASGDFTAAARLRTSLQRNVKFYIVYLAASVLGLMWLIVSGEVKGSLESWCIAASNAWGLLVLTVLMGFGLVGVPRNLWCLACPREQLHRLYISAATKDELRLSRLFELHDCMEQVRAELNAGGLVGDGDPRDASAPATRRMMAVAFGAMQQTLERCEQMHRELTHGRSIDEGVAHIPHQNSSVLHAARTCGPAARLRRLAQLHRSLKAASLEARRSVSRWDDHVQRCMFFEDLDGQHFKAAAELLSARPHGGLPRGCCAHPRSLAWLCWRRLLALWLRRLRGRALRLLSYCCSLLSATIVLGQLSMFSERGWSWMSPLSCLFGRDLGPCLTQLLCVIPLSYMTYTAYFSIFRLRVPGWYGLYGNHNTDMGSLLWCASILARLAAPLCYHFLLLVKVKGTTFQNFMGKMNVVPVLGESFNDIFPCLVALLCLFNLLNVYDRIVRCLSLGLIDFELVAGAGGEDPRAEGRQLIERERRRRAEDTSVELPARERLAVPLAPPAG